MFLSDMEDPHKTLEEGYTLEEVLEFIEIDIENNQATFERFAKFGVPQHVIDRATENRNHLLEYKEDLIKRIGEQ